MKITNLNFVKRNMASVLLTASIIMPLTAATEVASAPLNLNAIIHEDFGFRPGCASQFGGTITGIGISSLLGTVSLDGNDCITPVANGFSFDGLMTFTVSDGDEIFADYEGLLTPTSRPSIYTFTDSSFKIMGGTGNFLHAKGDGRLYGFEQLDLASGKGWGVLRATGKITNFTKDSDKKRDKKEKDKDEKDKNGKENGRQDTQHADKRMAGNADNSPLAGPSYITVIDPGSSLLSSQAKQVVSINALPESGSLSLLGIGLVGLVMLRQRRLKINLTT